MKNENKMANISEGTILNVLMMMTNEAYTLLLWVDVHHSNKQKQHLLEMIYDYCDKLFIIQLN